MMEEVAIRDPRTVEQISEDEILACLVAEAAADAKVPSKKAKLKVGDDQSKKGNEDPIDKYQRENKQLLQASLRLEQENDSLAHRLVTSKIALRNSLDEAEDTVDDLMEQLNQTKHLLRTTEEEKRSKEQEAALLKDLFRTKLEIAEREVKRTSGIVADYKQICSQLTLRLEVQQATHREELEVFQSVMKACPSCRHVLEPWVGEGAESNADSSSSNEIGGNGRDVAATTPAPTEGSGEAGEGEEEARRKAEQYVAHSMRAEQQREEQRSRREKQELELQIRGLEKELAQTKLLVVEANCTIQGLEHQNGLLSSDVQAARNSWFTKTFTARRASIHNDEAPPPAWSIPAAWSVKRAAWHNKDSRGDF